MTPPPRTIAQIVSRLWNPVYGRITPATAALALAACSSSRPAPRPLLAGTAQEAAAADPSKTPHHGWDAVDDAVRAGAIEHVVVATPIESVGVRFRTYRLLGPRDQPGELLVERTDAGVALTIRLGRFGEPELEAEVLDAIRRALRDADSREPPRPHG